MIVGVLCVCSKHLLSSSPLKVFRFEFCRIVAAFKQVPQVRAPRETSEKALIPPGVHQPRSGHNNHTEAGAGATSRRSTPAGVQPRGASSPPPRASMQQNKAFRSHDEVPPPAEERVLLQKPTATNVHFIRDEPQNFPGRGRFRPSTAGQGTRPSLPGNSGGTRRRDADGDDVGDGTGRARRSAENSDSLDVRDSVGGNVAGGRWNMSGPDEPNGPWGNNDMNGLLQNTRDKTSGDKRLRDVQTAGMVEGGRERGGSRQKSEISWVAPPREIAERGSARSVTATIADGYLVKDVRHHGLGRGSGGRGTSTTAHDAVAREETGGDGLGTVSARSNEGRRPTKERLGDRYYLPPPRRNVPRRTSTDDTSSTNSEATERQRGNKRSERRERRPREHGEDEARHREPRTRESSVAMMPRGDGSADAASSERSQRREKRTGLSSGQPHDPQRDDLRPISGPADTSATSNVPDWRYGWRGPFTTTSSTCSQGEEEYLPFYLSSKQYVRLSWKRSRRAWLQSIEEKRVVHEAHAYTCHFSCRKSTKSPRRWNVYTTTVVKPGLCRSVVQSQGPRAEWRISLHNSPASQERFRPSWKLSSAETRLGRSRTAMHPCSLALTDCVGRVSTRSSFSRIKYGESAQSRR